MDERLAFWSAETAQVNTDGLPEFPLEVKRLDAQQGDPAWVILEMPPQDGCQYRWQKAPDKGLEHLGTAIWLWTDCVALPGANSYTLSGNELHAADRYRCLLYSRDSVIAVGSWQVTWEEEKRCRQVVQQEFAAVREIVENAREAVKNYQSLQRELDAAHRKIQELQTDYDQVKAQCRSELEEEYAQKEAMMRARVESVRQWARGWENRARRAQAQLGGSEEISIEELPGQVSME